MLSKILKLKSKRSENNENNREYFENVEVTCPKCHVTYKSSFVQSAPVTCKDCGCVYIQKTHSDKVIDWVREKIRTVGGC